MSSSQELTCWVKPRIVNTVKSQARLPTLIHAPLQWWLSVVWLVLALGLYSRALTCMGEYVLVRESDGAGVGSGDGSYRVNRGVLLESANPTSRANHKTVGWG